MHLSHRQLFLNHVAQTSPAPIGLEIVKASGIYLFDTSGNKYVDLISGFSVMNLGHGNPAVKDAITTQVDAYMHVMVYGEMIQAPQVLYAERLCKYLPDTLDAVYFTNSGTEAAEGAMKLAKRATGRSKIIAFNNAYHGSTQGALSIMGSEYWRNAFRPLLPDIIHAEYNNNLSLDAIDRDTACVICEVMQAEAGALPADEIWLQALKEKCTANGALLIFDEIQTGFGRTGNMWAFEYYKIVPDILLLGKALGGGLPLGAFVSSNAIMKTLVSDPVLGHITTFGGHPVSCAAGLAAFNALISLFKDEKLAQRTEEMELFFRKHLTHQLIKKITGRGLLLAIHFQNSAIAQKVCHDLLKAGIITDWFLFAPNALRIAPPLITDKKEAEEICETLHTVLNDINVGG